MQPLEDINNELDNLWAPISHLHSVMESEALRDAYNKTLDLLTEYHTELSQNETLYQAIKSLIKCDEYAHYTDAQKKILENEIRDFKLSGVHLPADKKAR